MEKQSFLQKFTGTITFKFILIGIISLILLIPASWVKHLILERQSRSREVFNEISSVWGGNQSIKGPVLTIPFKTYYKNTEGKVFEEIKKAHFLPEKLSLQGDLSPEIRYRSIFKIVVYNANAEINGVFKHPDFSELGIDDKNVLWDKAFFTLGITDMKGIKKEVSVNWNDNNLKVFPGSKSPEIISSGFHTKINDLNTGEEEFRFNIRLDLNGTGTFLVYPTGKNTEVALKSTWSDPGFTGSFLPYEREISEDGFSAKWKITHLNRNFPQQWTGKEFSVSGSDFGVELINPVDHYQQSFRSVKYAMMFICMTFLIFLLIEILQRKKMHPVQYVLTGIALIVFYSLLVSLSEHFGFKTAYLISSMSVIGLISYYIQANFHKVKLTVLTTTSLIALYMFLYIILRMQDYALLFGSIGIFVVLTMFMVLTRRVNWYKEEETSS